MIRPEKSICMSRMLRLCSSNSVQKQADDPLVRIAGENVRTTVHNQIYTSQSPKSSPTSSDDPVSNLALLEQTIDNWLRKIPIGSRRSRELRRFKRQLQTRIQEIAPVTAPRGQKVEGAA
jgi:hypothetical protein